MKKALDRTEYDASDIVAKLIFYTLFLFVLQMASGVFGPNPISELLFGVIAYLPQVIAAIVIVVVTAAIAKGVKDLVSATLGGLSYGDTLASTASGAIVVVGVFAALDTLGIAGSIVNGLFYAMLAIIAGSAIVAVGGGGIQPMRERWERTLQRYDEEKATCAPSPAGRTETAAASATRTAPSKSCARWPPSVTSTAARR